MSQAVASPVVKQATFLGHPVGLYVLFFTEMWERFSYYGMRALLMLYMLNAFRYSQQYASSIYKIYTSLVYVTPIIGGYLADRYLGNKRAVIIGAVLMAIGHFLMAGNSYAIFMSALVFLILGNGFFKPNMSTQVGRLYPANDGRRDGAYTIFYMGINLGAFLSPIICGWLAENTVGGYHSGFTMAGIGMVCGLVIYLVGQPLIRELPNEPAPTKADEKEPAALPVAAAKAAGEGVVTAPAVTGVLGGPAVTGVIGTGADGPVSRGATEEPVPAVVSVDALTEAEASRQPSVFGGTVALIPTALAVVGGLLILGALGWGLYLLVPALRLGDKGKLWDTCLKLFDPFMLSLGGVCLLLIAFVTRQVRQGMRDRVMAILVLGVFVMFFWAAFEQAGNVLNVWADKNTDRNITTPKTPAEVATVKLDEEEKKEGESAGGGAGGELLERFKNMFKLKPTLADKKQQNWGEWLFSSFNPMPTAWFQSINALAIFVLAPLFAYMWIKLDKAGMQPSIPMKMAIGLFFMALSVAVMMGAASQESKNTTVSLRSAALPYSLSTGKGNAVGPRTGRGEPFKPFFAGLLTYDEAAKELSARGVLPDTEADVIIGTTAPEGFVKQLEELEKKSKTINGGDVKSVEVTLDPVPPGFDMKYSLVKPSVVKYDAEAHTLTAYKELQEKEEKGLKVAAGDPQFRATIHDLYVQSNQFRVSAWWLFWSYILATLGELCLSPVGLSMVSKLAPARFATMLMGVWMLTSAFGNFAAGRLGETWGTVAPITFFMWTTVVVGVAALVLLALVRGVTRTMHGVK